VSVLEGVGLVTGLALIVIPEPITSATGTALGAVIVAGIFGKQAFAEERRHRHGRRGRRK